MLYFSYVWHYNCISCGMTTYNKELINWLIDWKSIGLRLLYDIRSTDLYCFAADSHCRLHAFVLRKSFLRSRPLLSGQRTTVYKWQIAIVCNMSIADAELIKRNCKTLTVTITFTLSEIIVLRPRSTPANSVSSPSTYPVGAYEQFKHRLHDTTCCQTGCQNGLTTGWRIVYTNIEPVVKSVWQPLWQPVERTAAVRSTRLSNRLSNRLYNAVWQPAVSCKRGIRQALTYSLSTLTW